MLRSSGIRLGALACGALVVTLVGSCESGNGSGPLRDSSMPTPDAMMDQTSLPVADAGGVEDAPVIPFDSADMPPTGTFCALPGSVVSTSSGMMIVPSADDAATPDALTLEWLLDNQKAWLNLPVGFCMHFFAQVPEVRQLRFAPGGDLFAASPSTPCSGGASGGLGAIVVLPDDNHDGVADRTTDAGGPPFGRSFFPTPGGSQTITSTQGLAFGGGYFYFQDGTTIRRLPFKAGDRAPSGAISTVTTITVPQASEHWAKMLDFAQDGTLYITNGSTQGQACLSSASPSYVPVFGAVFKLEPGGSVSEVARGFRNPIALRCEQDHDVCFVAELALDGSGGSGGREKVVPLRQGDDWGFPCCATQNTPYQGAVYADTSKTPNCSGVAADTVSFDVGHTPFGIDVEPGLWPAPWTGRVFVTLHGDVGSWQGARVVGIAKDPSTGLLLPASELAGGSTNANDMLDFATGWDDGMQDHGRPAPIAFAPDGRMFIGDDMNGLVVWVAPVGLTQ